MLKKYIWKTFEQTGSIDAYIFYKEIEQRQSGIDIEMPYRDTKNEISDELN